MSWNPLTPPVPKVSKGRHAPLVTVAVTQRKAGPALNLTIRPALGALLPWLKRGAFVEVLVGVAEHAGMLRVVPDGRFRVACAGGRRPDGEHPVVTIKVPHLPGVRLSAQPAVGVEHEFHDEWLEITLPSWALPAHPAPAQAPPDPAPATTTRPPFRGLGSTTPDPAAASAHLAPAKAPPDPAPATTNRPPFRGLGSTTPDPAAAGRKGYGPVRP